MKFALVVAALALAIAIVWALVAASYAPGPRSTDLTLAVSDNWYESLPRDAASAAEAYFDRVPAEMRERGEQVSRTRYWVFSARLIATAAVGALFLFSGAAAQLAATLKKATRRVWLQDFLFAVVFLAFLFAILLPIEVYAGFVRFRHFGFAEQPFLSWLQDAALNAAIMAGFNGVGVVAVFALMRRTPRFWPAFAGSVYLVLAGAYTLMTPVVIEPLFNSYTPLPDSAIKGEILAMARANAVPVKEVYASDASRQSRLLNAHVSGFAGTAKITLDDNLLTERYEPAVLWVVAHELGHYARQHVMGAVLFSTLVAIAGFVFIAVAGGLAVRRLGKAWGISSLHDTAGIAVVWTGYLLFSILSLPATNAFSRWQEADADRFGLEASRAPHGMAEFMIHDADTARLDPSRLDVFLFYDHPSDRSRVEAAMRWRQAHALSGPE